ncbi:MAG: aminotransferase class V-fold PLP-dependent enzyme [Pseudomonadota bacterium]
MIDDAQLREIRAETPGFAHGAHLLACGSALQPKPVVDAVIDHLKLEAEIGGYEAAAANAAAHEDVHDCVAAHIGAAPEEIAIVENATVAWQHAFYALPLRPGARILTAEAEYAANYVAFLQRAKRDDLTVEVIPSDETGQLDTKALEAMMGPDVGLIAITWVPTNGGLVNPAAEVGRVARLHGVPYLLDACQAAGQMRIDVEAIGCDFLSATARKFLRGPRGIGFLYVSKSQLETIEPAMIDFYGAPWVARDEYQLRPDARRFENWENAYALRAGLSAAMAYADRIGIDAIEARVAHLGGFCADLGDALPGVTNMDLGVTRSGIVSFALDGADASGIADELRQSGFSVGTSGPGTTRIDAEKRDLPTLLRIAPHYYNTEEEVAGCVKRLGELMEASA